MGAYVANANWDYDEVRRHLIPRSLCAAQEWLEPRSASPPRILVPAELILLLLEVC